MEAKKKKLEVLAHRSTVNNLTCISNSSEEKNECLSLIQGNDKCLQ